MATHSTILTWKISWIEDPGKLQPTGSQKTQTQLSTHTHKLQCRRHKRHGFDTWVRKIPWRRKWQPTPVSLPGKYHEQRSLAGYRPLGHKDPDTTEMT